MREILRERMAGVGLALCLMMIGAWQPGCKERMAQEPRQAQGEGGQDEPQEAPVRSRERSGAREDLSRTITALQAYKVGLAEALKWKDDAVLASTDAALASTWGRRSSWELLFQSPSALKETPNASTLRVRVEEGKATQEIDPKALPPVASDPALWKVDSSRAITVALREGGRDFVSDPQNANIEISLTARDLLPEDQRKHAPEWVWSIRMSTGGNAPWDCNIDAAKGTRVFITAMERQSLTMNTKSSAEVLALLDREAKGWSDDAKMVRLFSMGQASGAPGKFVDWKANYFSEKQHAYRTLSYQMGQVKLERLRPSSTSPKGYPPEGIIDSTVAVEKAVAHHVAAGKAEPGEATRCILTAKAGEPSMPVWEVVLADADTAVVDGLTGAVLETKPVVKVSRSRNRERRILPRQPGSRKVIRKERHFDAR